MTTPGETEKALCRLQALTGRLLDDRDLKLRLDQFAGEAHALLKELDLNQLLTQTLGQETAAELSQETTGFLHLGFLAPPNCGQGDLAKASARAQFEAEQVSFQSEVMNRELAHRAGLSHIPTTIFKAFAQAESGRKNGLEAFICEVEPERLRAWIAAGVGTHLGIGLRRRAAVWRAVELCRKAGFSPPEFLAGAPAVNQAEDILVIYADGRFQGQPLRLEFYHAASEQAL